MVSIPRQLFIIILVTISAVIRIDLFGFLVALRWPYHYRGTLVSALWLWFDRILVLLRLLEPKKSVHFFSFNILKSISVISLMKSWFILICVNYYNSKLLFASLKFKLLL